MKKNMILSAVFFMCLLINSCEDGNDSAHKAKPFEKLDSAAVSMMEDFCLAAVSLAVVRDDRLVYQKAYGYSDRENSIPAKTDDFFRIASISKLFTAVSILRLIEEGKISFDDRVFGAGSIFGDEYGTPGTHVSDVTVRHLLEYGSGFADGSPGVASDSRAGLIRNRVTNGLLIPPGTNYGYKNIEYLILGRIIEKIAGSDYEKSYQECVQDIVLSNCGITDMAIGGSERKPNEVNYYTPAGPLNISSLAMMDSYAGWIASSADLAKLLVRINRSPVKEDILSAIYTTYKPSQAAVLVNNIPSFANDSWFYAGSMAGTRAITCKLNDRTGYVLLANTSVSDSDNVKFFARLAGIEKAIRAISEWPPDDGFNTP